MSNALPCPKLYDGHAAGHYTLPDELVAVRATFDKVQAQPFPEPPENAWTVIQRVAVETVDAVQNGTPLPDPAQIEAARSAERVYQDVLDMMDQCKELATARARSAVGTHAIGIITDHLRPAHDATVSAFTDAHQILNEYGEHAPRRLLSAPAKVRKASDTCDAMADRYAVIRAARMELWSARGIRCDTDPNGKYLFLRNHHGLFPIRLAMAKPPWADLNIRDYLGWMVDHGGQLWMPTPDEQAEAVADEAGMARPKLPVTRAA
ncbi:hypothetical protein ACFYVL_39945 [Streptomyces sp. NPDC004111]|uniref:hypothetical protein n=1 Tax=Streptomyces sp. NPDC004111 TaxID=3364690 RepID=UPI0036A50DD1